MLTNLRDVREEVAWMSLLWMRMKMIIQTPVQAEAPPHYRYGIHQIN